MKIIIIIIIITIKITRIIIIKETAIRMIIIFINKILAYVNQDYFIFSNAQNAANVIINDNDNTYRNSINENEEIDYIKMIFVKTLIAFELTRVNSRCDVNRIKVIRENTHITKINGDLIRVNVVS